MLPAKRYADAEQVYRADLADHPHNGWSLFGLQQALQGRRDLDLALVPGESVNDDGLFIDSMSLALLASTVPVEVRASKDFTDALQTPVAA